MLDWNDDEDDRDEVETGLLCSMYGCLLYLGLPLLVLVTPSIVVGLFWWYCQ